MTEKIQKAIDKIDQEAEKEAAKEYKACLLYTSPSPRD